MTERATVTVRMYNVGFGDAFLVTVRRGKRVWRMLVDCGVHRASVSRPIEESVQNIIDDLKLSCDPHPPRLDVLVATHRHQDHISGFASERWRDVYVDEVWLPFVENEHDEDTVALNQMVSMKTSANALTSLIAARAEAPGLGLTEQKTLQLASDLALNSTENSAAMDRLLERNRSGFAKPVAVRRFLPEKDPINNRIEVKDLGIVAHILGPSRDPAVIKKMRPPANAGWFALADGDTEPESARAALFDESFVLDESFVHASPGHEIAEAVKRHNLHKVTLGEEALLAAASLLDKSINNTSLFFILEVGSTNFLFPGDAQVGSWNHAREAPEWKDLVKDVAFYKVGHHGSHNATSPNFLDAEWSPDRGEAMLPWRRVGQWKKIPDERIMNKLVEQGHRIIKPIADGDAPDQPGGGKLTRTEWWSELVFKA